MGYADNASAANSKCAATRLSTVSAWTEDMQNTSYSAPKQSYEFPPMSTPPNTHLFSAPALPSSTVSESSIFLPERSLQFKDSVDWDTWQFNV